MQKKRRKWYFKELAELEKRNVISAAALENILNYYEAEPPDDLNRTRLLTIFGILGGFLIGCGVILLLAHNWSSLNRIVQSALFIIPLIAVQAVSFIFLLKNNISHFWYETIGIIYYLLIGAAVAMISRIYHVGGDLEGFLLIWAAGGLPVCYFLGSDSAAVMYLITSFIWAAIAQDNGGIAVLFWLLFAAVLPLLFRSFSKNRDIYHRGFIEIIVITTLTLSIGVTLEKVLPGLWIPIYFGFFILLFFIGDRRRDSLRLSRGAGILGITVLSVLMTVSRLWNNVGFSGIRDGYRFHAAAAYLDYAILAVIIFSIIFILVKDHASLTPAKILILSAAVPAAAGFFFPDYGAFIFHIFIFVLGYSFTFKKLIKNEQRTLTFTGLLMIFVSMIVHLAVYEGFSYYWIFLYSCFLVVIFINSRLFISRSFSVYDRLLRLICLLTGLGLLYGLSFSSHRLPVFPDRMDFSVFFIFPPVISLAAVLNHLIPQFKSNRKTVLLISVFPVLSLISLVTGADLTLFYNLYLFCIGIIIIIYGINLRSIRTANGGIIITLILIVTRFFDVDMSFSTRGIVFILLGGVFIVFNLVFSRRFRGEAQK